MSNRSVIVPQRLEAHIRGQASHIQPPAPLDEAQRQALIARIKQLLKLENAVLVAHYYVDEELQILTEETGGCVADSLGMADFGSRHPATKLVVIGVRFMGETAKILNPEKRVFMPELEATCSLDLGCPADEFTRFCDEHPERVVVVYANTSAAVKARSDWVVTSGNAVDIVGHLHAQGKKIIFAPDKHLGRYVQEQTGADMLRWMGSCVVHEEFRADELRALMAKHPDAEVLVHPESPKDVVELADVVGSTTRLIKAVKESVAQEFIVATDYGIFHKMHQAAPEKKLLVAPTSGLSPSCHMCAHCPWMGQNSLQALHDVLEQGHNEIHIEEAIRVRAKLPIQRMLDFSTQKKGAVVSQEAVPV